MKKCPYCAEEIQDEAIVCRYCGRDLLLPVQPVEPVQPASQPEHPKPVQKTIWKASQPAAVVIAILYVLNVFRTTSNPTELAGDLTLGLLVTFLVWWAICALIVWLWRAAGTPAFVLLGITVLIIILAWTNNQPSFSPPPAPTATRAQTSTPRPRPTATKPTTTQLRASNCTLWHELRNSLVGKTVCVQGEISSITGNSETSPITRIYFKSNLPDGYVWTDGSPSAFYFVDETYFYRDLSEGDCVAANGTISINDSGELFMRIEGNLKTCS